MANKLSVDQVSTVIRAVLKQSTGQEQIDALDINELLTIGQKQLLENADPVMNAISQMVSRTVFSAREYTGKFAQMQRDPEAWGNIVRKIAIVETPDDVEDNPYIPLTDGESVDQYTVKKPKALQLNFYGQQTWEIAKTIFDTQLNVCFNSIQDFERFIGMVYTYVNNKVNKIHEDTARSTITGFAAGKIAGDTSNVVHLLTEYNAETGLNLTRENVKAPENFGAFFKWMYAKIQQVSDLMTEYSIKFHTNLADGVIMRHTPKEYQQLYFLNSFLRESTSRVLADTYHDTILQLPGAETVNFWQDIDNPAKINIKTPNYLDADGNIKAHSANVEQDDVVAVLADIEAFGYSPIMDRVKTSPYNAKGEYYNVYWKFNERYWMDFTENGVVFILD